MRFRNNYKKYLLPLMAAIMITGLVLGSKFSAVKTYAMGFDSDEEAQYSQQLWDSGASWEEMEQKGAEWRIEHGYGVAGYTDNTSTTTETAPATTETTPAPVETTPAPSATTEQTTPAPTTTTDNTAKTTTTKAKTYSHDFATIDDDAKKALAYFSSDDEAGNMYLNITMGSAFNTLTGKELSATTTKGEVATINYVLSDGEAQFTWMFENFDADDTFSIDLSAFLNPAEVEGLDLAYKVDVLPCELPEGKSVTLKVNAPFPDGSKVNAFEVTDAGVGEKIREFDVVDGFITLTYENKVVPYIISISDLASLTETVEATEEVSVEVIEPEVTEVTEDAVEPATTEDPAEVTESSNNNILIITVIAALAVLAVIAGIFIKKKKN